LTSEAYQLEVASTLLSSNHYMKKIGYLELFRSKIGSLMTKNDFDALLLPGGMLPAYSKKNAFSLTHLQTISMLPNLLKMTMGCVPVKHVEASEENYFGYNGDRYTRVIRESLVGTTGLPVGVQVCSLRYQEEKCLRVMGEIQKLVNFKH